MGMFDKSTVVLDIDAVGIVHLTARGVEHLHLHFMGSPAATQPQPGEEDDTAAILEEKITQMSAQLDNLIREVAESDTAVGSVVALVTGLREQVATISAELTQQGVDTAKLDELATQLDAQQARIASAVVVNTPAVDPTASETPPVADPVAPADPSAGDPPESTGDGEPVG